MRLVSLLPSATEIVYALGLGDQLVGVTFECDHPAEARTECRIVVGGRDTSSMTSAEIDRYVRETMAGGGDLYTLHADALAELAADLVLTQDLCRVCAIPSGHVSDALTHLGCTADVLSLDPYTLDEVVDTFRQVGERTSRVAQANALIDDFRRRMHAVERRVAGQPRPRVALIEWVDPPFVAGHWIPDLVRAAGGEPVAHRGGRRSEQVSWTEIADERPDLIVVAPCGYHLDGAASLAQSVADRFPDVPVWAVDADGLIVRPGPRLIDGIEALADLFHPTAEHPTSTAVRRVAPANAMLNR